MLEYGPQFPKSYDQSDFSFQALLRSNWPMVVEYELERQATAVVTIRVKDAAPFTQTLAGGGLGERRTVSFTLPVYREGLHPALITFKATRPGPSGDERAEFHFIGAGAGEGEDGARMKEPSGVEVASLGPLPLDGGLFARAHAGRPYARGLRVYDLTLRQVPGGYLYSFRPGARFNRWGADIRKNVQNRNRRESLTVRNDARYAQPIGPKLGPVTKTWNGLNNRYKSVGPGTYWVQVMVSVAAENGGDWDVTTASDDSITIK